MSEKSKSSAQAQKEQKRAIQREVEQVLAESGDKQKAYEALVQNFKDRRLVAQSLQALISPARWRRYRVWNFLLLLLLIALAIPLLLELNWAVLPVLYGLYVVSFRKLRAYAWVALLGAVLVLSTGALFLVDTETNLGVSLAMLGIGLLLLAGGLGLPPLLSPRYQEYREPYRDAAGQTKQRLQYRFPAGA